VVASKPSTTSAPSASQAPVRLGGCCTPVVGVGGPGIGGGACCGSSLDAGGVSLMARGHYLHPHIDNSHDMDRARYRVLNLLYYVSPDWRIEDGGHLELWPRGTRGEPLTLHSKFNRLVVIATNRTSWHSVSAVRTDRNRTCVSNYYFSPVSPEADDYFHVTSFRGRPGQPVRDLLLRADAALRALVRKLRPSGVVRTRHYYKR